MNIPALLSQRRRLRRRRPNPALISGLGLGGLLSFIMASLFFAVGGFYFWIVQDLPALEQIPAAIQDPDGTLRDPTSFYDRTGRILLYSLQHPGAADRQYLSAEPGRIDSIPLPLVEATLAVLQPDFWDSPGFDTQITASEAHPTLAQALVFDLLLDKESPGIRRNIRERLLARQLIQTYGHSTTLEWFLNSRQFGQLIYGADAASRAYFNTPASELSFAQAAWLTALAEMPGIDPYNPPARFENRQREILAAMFDQGRLTPDQIGQALQEKINLQVLPASVGLADELVNVAILQAEALLGSDQLARGGFRILTTLDANLQTEVTCTLAAQINRLENRQDSLSPDCLSGRLLPSLALNTPAPGNSLHGAAILVDTQTGQIQALSGNGMAPQQTGSLLTPFVYLSAFSKGFTPASLFWDLPPSEEASAENAQNYHGPLLLRAALANNYSGPAEQLLNQLGNRSVQEIAIEFGLTNQAATFTAVMDDLQNRPALVGGESTLLDVARAFNILANGGVAAGQLLPGSGVNTGLAPDSKYLGGTLSLSAILMIYDNAGQVVVDWTLPTTQPVASSALAYLLNHILSDQAARWPSLGHPNPLEIGRPVAAHIGRIPDHRIGWTVGYTPFLTNVVWLAVDGEMQGWDGMAQLPDAAAGVWHALMQHASQAFSPDSWGVPPGITTMTVCAASGLLPSAACPETVSEVFLNGSEPVQVDNVFRTFAVNRDNASLATVFTPPELIEERTFMVVPPEAIAWARQNLLPLPPDSYDIIYNQRSNPNAQITSPGIFDHVHGTLQIRGSADGLDFKYYRVQVGQGLNPQSWIQLGSDQTTRVTNGVLAEWDTRELSGLYAVQLLVIGANQKLETAVTQVTIDNQPPSISVQAESDGEQSGGMVFHAEASDDLELKNVAFYVNDSLIGNLTDPPFSIYWRGRSGTHEIRAVAYDLAGNTSEAVLSFELK